MMWASILVTVLCASTGGALSIPPTNLASRGLASCGKPLPLGQSIGHVSNVTISSGGNERNFLVSIPPSYSKDVPTPLMLSYHGGTKTSIQQLQLDDLTDPEFNPFAIVVYPQGINNTWQGVPGVTTDDVQFTTDILSHVESLYCIDAAKIYATGKSDGAGFCNILACDPTLSTKIAAFAPVSGAYYVDTLPCYPSTVNFTCAAGRSDIPLLAFHGGNDTVIAYLGGERKDECLPTIPHFIQAWATRDGLGTHNVTTSIANSTVDYVFGSGPNTGLVRHIYDSVIGHDWPSTAPNADNSEAGHHPASFNATPIILHFFEKHPLRLSW